MEAINDSMRRVSKAIELLKEYLSHPDDVLLTNACSLLEQTVEVLSKSAK